MVISKHDLETRLPEFAAAASTLFEKVLPYVNEALTGRTPAEPLGALPAALAYAATQKEMEETLKDYAIFEGVRTALPHVDLVVTPTGFGVVSNQNLAPASRERVNAVRESLRGLSCAARDRILHAYYTANPTECVLVFPTPATAAAAGIAPESGGGLWVKEYFALLPAMRGAQACLAERFSDGFTRAVCAARYTADEAGRAALAPVLESFEEYVVTCVMEAGRRAKMIERRVYRYLESLPAPARRYAEIWYSSAAREAWVKARYQNTAGSPVFYFG